MKGDFLISLPAPSRSPPPLLRKAQMTHAFTDSKLGERRHQQGVLKGGEEVRGGRRVTRKGWGQLPAQQGLDFATPPPGLQGSSRHAAIFYHEWMTGGAGGSRRFPLIRSCLLFTCSLDLLSLR